MAKRKYLAIALSMAFLASCSVEEGKIQDADSIDGALIMLEGVFEGQHGKLEIGEMMDTVLFLYQVELTQENYLKYGNMLAEKRILNDGSITEMDILGHMISAYPADKRITFSEQLDRSVRVLESELGQTVEGT